MMLLNDCCCCSCATPVDAPASQNHTTGNTNNFFTNSSSCSKVAAGIIMEEVGGRHGPPGHLSSRISAFAHVLSPFVPAKEPSDASAVCVTLGPRFRGDERICDTS